MRVGTGVEYDAVEGESHLLHLVDHLTLYVALKVFQFHFFVASLQLWQVRIERTGAVDARFACAQQVQVGSVEYQYFHFFVVQFCCKYR